MLLKKTEKRKKNLLSFILNKRRESVQEEKHFGRINPRMLQQQCFSRVYRPLVYGTLLSFYSIFLVFNCNAV